MFISAAPVGAVPKYLDASEPKFISGLLLDLFLSAAERAKLVQVLAQNGWEFAAPGGIALQAGYRETVMKDQLALLDHEGQSRAVAWLSREGWIEQETAWCKAPVASSRVQAKLERQDLLSISCEKELKSIVLLLTTQGWQATPEGDLEWRHEKLSSYLPADLVSKIEKLSPRLMSKLLASGWTHREGGYWQAGKSRSPYLPVTPEAIARESHLCFREGAAIVHLHTRDMGDLEHLRIPGIDATVSVGAQKNHIDLDQYELIVPAILKQDPAGIINLSTSVRGDLTPFDSPLRRAHLKSYGARPVIPDVGSFSPGPVLFQSGGGYENPAAFIAEQLTHFKSHRIRPEIEVFNHTILENAVTACRDELEKAGLPVLFMLVAGVDQYKKCSETGTLSDDSLIPVQARETISELLQNADETSRQEAASIAARYLSVAVDRIRASFSQAKISALMPGSMQMILADVALRIGLDGVRVGLEDSLTVSAPTVPGGTRKATSSSEQVRVIRQQLEAHGVQVLRSEELRDLLGMERADIKLFRQASALLAPYCGDVRDIAKLPDASHVLAELAPLLDQYHKLENGFVSELLRRLPPAMPGALSLSMRVRELAESHGLYIRYFIEEKDRYTSPSLAMGDIHTVQSLNFARELFAERNLSTAYFDDALREASAEESEHADYLVSRDQFKSLDLRFLEFLSAIPCKYNTDRTAVINLQLRRDPNYSATMAVLFHAIKGLTLALRDKSQADSKQHGLHWYLSSARSPGPDGKRHGLSTFIVDADEVASALQQADWVVLPSTPTTNYPHGLKLSYGLTGTFCQFLTAIATARAPISHSHAEAKKQPVLLGIAHSGLQEDGETIIEASMLHNRFALNTDASKSYASHSSRLIYERLLLPRLVEHPATLAYTESGLVQRDETGIPVYRDQTRAKRIGRNAISDVPLMKMLAHSSGITTAQQLDNLMRMDMDRLGFLHEEQEALYNRAIVLSFASASNTHLDFPGAPVIDITAFNDIRSLAGTTTEDYLLSSPDMHAYLEHTLHAWRERRLHRKFTYAHAQPILRTGGRYGKTLLRLKDVFLLDDPARVHDGHSIKKYLDDSPPFVREWVAILHEAQRSEDAKRLIERLYDCDRTLVLEPQTQGAIREQQHPCAA